MQDSSESASTTMQPAHTRASFPVVLFQHSSAGLELLNCGREDSPGLIPAQWLEISQGGWQRLIPEEFHSAVWKLARLPLSEGYTVVEFPVYWLGTTVWLRVFAATVEEPGGGKKIVGLAQDVSSQREWPYVAFAATEEESDEDASDSLERFCHDISGPLTSILVNCELLKEGDCSSPVRQKVETILSEALHIDRYLRSYRRS